ncbi:MAG: polynucleotide adenylyltransferase PcnB [Gammaproteobacteria bacterium]
MPGLSTGSPRIIPRPEHSISRANISANALKVLYRLKDAGYQAHLVGGGVRDLLLGREPKDFDIATDATPEQVRDLFRNCRLIGRRFRLAHVHFGREIIEVATFRAPHEAGEAHEGQLGGDGMIVRDNVFGTLEEDAVRRDFTINALYYDISDFSIVDYADGMDDIENGLIRLIGDPETRYREDPVRMLRAIRFMAKLGFRMAPESEAPLSEMGELLDSVPPARLFEESLKLFMSGHGVASFEHLRHYGLFEDLFPETDDALHEEHDGFPQTFLLRALENTDKRVMDGRPVTPVFLFAAILWPAVRARLRAMAAEDWNVEHVREAGNEVVEEQREFIAIPKRFSLPMREIWEMQPRLTRRKGRRAYRLITHPRFRAAYDFLCLRAEAGDESPDHCAWWTRFQESDSDGQRSMTDEGGGGDGKRRRRRRRRPAKGDSAVDPGTKGRTGGGEAS